MMPTELVITCGEDQEGQQPYQVILTAKDLRVFEKAKADPSTKNKTGEALVAAIVALGGILKVDRRNKDGQRSDGPHGEPCLVMFNDNGTPRAIRRFTNGLLSDGKNGEIAVQQFSHTGDKLVYALRYTNGVRGHKLAEAEREAYLAGVNSASCRRAAKSINGASETPSALQKPPTLI